MSNSNQSTFIGNATADPELRYTQSGKPVAHLRVASDERVQVNGVWESRPTFMNVVIWDKLAENTAASVRKGDRVVVMSRIAVREYEPETGDKRYFTELVATEVAVSLRWASVSDIERNERTQREPALAAAGAPHNGDPVYGEEEPF